MVLVLPWDVALVIVELLDDDAEPFVFLRRGDTSASHWDRIAFTFIIRQFDRSLLCHFLAVAVRIGGFENAHRQYFFERCRELRNQEIQENRDLNPFRVWEVRDCGARVKPPDDRVCFACGFFDMRSFREFRDDEPEHIMILPVNRLDQ